MNIAVIPARGGSKRIPRKNIKDFCGKPIIAWSIEVARESGLFSNVIVSTDDDEIAQISKEFGAEVPFVRPEELSNDFVGTTKVIAHSTNWALNKYSNLEAVCCIYATAPFIQVQDLVVAFKKLKSEKKDYVFSITDFGTSIFRSFQLDSNGGLEMFFPEHFDTRSQDLPSAFHDAAQFYWGDTKSWIEEKKMFSKNSGAITLPRWRVQDIDTPDDWIRAEKIFKNIKNI
ncbi:pseudaminic acid cytidylyltransferase [Polynucleobacter rarus]|uniref:pseudaminic acid cytidylyltransferase n=1 Tax=Polynucleobacter rarus TaxID=556055 RepID=UPI000D3E10CB|nr:pseudaminic acid cytidylyltransferase [Polynucleobacter rarus]